MVGGCVGKMEVGERIVKKVEGLWEVVGWIMR